MIACERMVNWNENLIYGKLCCIIKIIGCAYELLSAEGRGHCDVMGYVGVCEAKLLAGKRSVE